MNVKLKPKQEELIDEARVDTKVITSIVEKSSTSLYVDHTY